MSGSHSCPFASGENETRGSGLEFLLESAAAAGLNREKMLARLEVLAASPPDRPLPLSEDELAWAGRVAWRNHARCIGRLYWRTLQVRDRRQVESAEAVIDELLEHLRLAYQGGQIRPMLTVFAPGSSARRVRIWNQQVCGYAGYRLPNGRILGDPKNADFTDRALALGWRPPRERSGFDLLPLVVTGCDGVTRMRTLPATAVPEVQLVHPEHPGVEKLALRWYAVPLVCDMVLRVAGTEFPAAPFNGWYMATEIGARNLADRGRYDLLPRIAQVFGFDTTRNDTLWQDRALVELNRAVLHSFDRAGVRIVDHHTASQEFMQFLQRENVAGRTVSARWDWIVPPMSGSATPVFHTPMQEHQFSPDFFHPDPSGSAGLPFGSASSPPAGVLRPAEPVLAKVPAPADKHPRRNQHGKK